MIREGIVHAVEQKEITRCLFRILSTMGFQIAAVCQHANLGLLKRLTLVQFQKTLTHIVPCMLFLHVNKIRTQFNGTT